MKGTILSRSKRSSSGLFTMKLTDLPKTKTARKAFSLKSQDFTATLCTLKASFPMQLSNTFSQLALWSLLTSFESIWTFPRSIFWFSILRKFMKEKLPKKNTLPFCWTVMSKNKKYKILAIFFQNHPFKVISLTLKRQSKFAKTWLIMKKQWSWPSKKVSMSFTWRFWLRTRKTTKRRWNTFEFECPWRKSKST